MEQNRHIMSYAKGLPNVPAGTRPAVAAESARMVGGRPPGVLRERRRRPTRFVDHPRGVRKGKAGPAAVRSTPDDEVVGVWLLHRRVQFAQNSEATSGRHPV